MGSTLTWPFETETWNEHGRILERQPGILFILLNNMERRLQRDLTLDTPEFRAELINILAQICAHLLARHRAQVELRPTIAAPSLTPAHAFVAEPEHEYHL